MRNTEDNKTHPQSQTLYVVITYGAYAVCSDKNWMALKLAISEVTQQATHMTHILWVV